MAASTSEQIRQLRIDIDNLRAQIVANDSAALIFAAFGETTLYGCKVTEGDDPDDMIVELQGQAPGDEVHWNPHIVDPPMRNYEFLNIASLKAAAFYAQDMQAIVEDAPASILGRYDIAYIFIGIQGAGFAVATGTPSTATKTDFDTNGLNTDPYNPASDVAIPVGGYPIARIYVDDSEDGVPDSRIADLRNFVI